MLNTTTTRHRHQTNKNSAFNRYFLVQSKPLLIALAFALLYCLFYGFILVHEFRKMGIIDIFMNSR